MIDLIYVGVSIIGCLAIVGYATWWLAGRLKAGGGAARSFRQWIRLVFEGFMGL